MSKKQEEKTEKKDVAKVAKKKTSKSTSKKSKEVKEAPVAEEVVEETPVAEEVVEEAPVAEELVEEKHEEFSWDSVLKDEVYSDKERAELINTYSETLPVVESKQVIDGIVAVSYTHPEPTRQEAISYAVFCLKKKKN